MAVSKLVQELKQDSSKWIKTKADRFQDCIEALLERCRNDKLALALDAGDHDQRRTSMTQQSGRYGYKPNERNGMSAQVVDRTKELAEEALDRADEWLKPTGLSIRERPMNVLAVVGGLAFDAGAFWMLKSSRQQSRYDELVATLSDLPRRAGWRS
jgi:hypothetical protein